MRRIVLFLEPICSDMVRVPTQNTGLQRAIRKPLAFWARWARPAILRFLASCVRNSDVRALPHHVVPKTNLTIHKTTNQCRVW
jgi:hypothetical protein